MSYFHVLIYLEEPRSTPSHVLSDLSEAQLREQFLEPYRKGRDVFLEPEVVKLAAIRKVRIIRTDRTSVTERADIQARSHREIEEMNQRGGPVILSAGRGYHAGDIVEAGSDVTADYIAGPPGYKSSSPAARFLSNPWVLVVGGGLVVAWLVWKLKWV